MMLKRLLRRDNKGIGAAEFALIAPVLISFVIGISQMGKLFFANADMKNALAHGARVASVWPVPNDATIIAEVNDRIARTSGLSKAQVTIVRDEDNNDNEFVTITMKYKVPLEFIFFNVGPITLVDSRQVFIQMDGETPAETTTSASTSASTSATSAGGTTSATSASSTGGTTSSTSASTTSSTTTSSTSSGKHDHGSCKKKC